ncbi:MAG: PhaM family polyhydroxyalkanoate granule multifunctional regulatory protein [Burkholderiaceae bacterium]
MTTPPAFDFQKMIPGFDFLKQLSTQGSTSIPMSSWVTPSLDPKEIEKKIQELKAIQFWLEQNSKALSATIQAMEVQRMTLSTLQGMNLSAEQLSQSLQFKTPDTKATKTPTNEETSAVDPMAWWGSLTQQFTQIAEKTVQDLQAHASASASAVKANTQKEKSNKRPAVNPKKQAGKSIRKP